MNAGVNTKIRLRKLFKKKAKRFKVNSSRKTPKVIIPTAVQISNPGIMILRKLLQKQIIRKRKKARLKRFKFKYVQKNMKLHIRTYKFFKPIIKNPIKSGLAFNHLRQLFIAYTKRRMVFRNKPYNYKLRKMKQPRWIFKYNKRKRKGKRRKTLQNLVLIRKKIIKTIKKSTALISLLRLKKVYLMKKYSNAPIIKPRGTPKIRNSLGVYKKAAFRKQKEKGRKKFRLKKWKRKPRSKMKVLLKRIKVIARYKQ